MGHSKDWVEQMLRWNFTGREYHQKFFELGREFIEVDEGRSRILARKYHCLPKQCFHNCYDVITNEPDLEYYSGYGCEIIPVDHAWLVNREGAVIDPTWVLNGEPDHAPDYFGLAVPKKILKKLPWKYLIEPVWFHVVKGENNGDV